MRSIYAHKRISVISNPATYVLELRRFRNLVETFTAIDLAQGRAMSEFTPPTDGNRETWWADTEPTAEIVIELGQVADAVRIRILASQAPAVLSRVMVYAA